MMKEKITFEDFVECTDFTRRYLVSYPSCAYNTKLCITYINGASILEIMRLDSCD